MKIKNVFLASLLTGLGVEVKAELIIDDSNGTSLTFPDISDIAEIAQGVAVDAPDSTYTIANGTDTITIVVVSGAVTSVTVDTAAPAASTELDAEVAAVLEAVVEAHKASKAEIVALKKELVELKASLQHAEEKPGAAAASQNPATKYKVV